MTALIIIIKTLFSPDNYHETRNINTSQAIMLLVPGHNCATLLHIMYLPYFSYGKQHGGLVLIVAVVEVLLQEDSFHF